LLNLLKTLLGLGVFGVGIRMVLPYQLTMSLSDFFLRSFFGQPKELIEILDGLHPF
jgi:hypothetical protein